MPTGFAWNLGVYSEKSAQVNETFKVTGMAELTKKLDSLLTSNPEMEKKIQKIIGKALKRVEKKLEKYAGGASVMRSDPRHAAKAIRYTVYRRVLGGNLNIFHGKQRGAESSYQPERHPSSGRGGNRMARSQRTQRLEGYEGADRSFILRFLNSGARVGGGNRSLGRGHFRVDNHRNDIKRGSQGGDVNKYGKTVNTGNRGHIAARNWFGNASQSAMDEAAAIIESEVDKAIAEVFGAAG